MIFNKSKILTFIYYIILFFLIIQFFYITKYIVTFFNKHFFTSELNLLERYGINSWVLITGCSSGQGKKLH